MSLLSSPIIDTKYQDWVIGSTTRVMPEQINNLLDLVTEPLSDKRPPLEGRSAVLIKRIEGLGSVVVKQYLRGGMMHGLLRNRYFKTGPCRAKTEFRMLLKASKSGINVPEPVFYFQRGNRIYNCWLVTKEIPNKGSIARISMTDPEQARSLMNKVSSQVEHLIQKGIYHVDFHPGNVLSGRDGKIYLIDFDKAMITKMGKTALAKKYTHRWNRAVLKHKLPQILLR